MSISEKHLIGVLLVLSILIFIPVPNSKLRGQSITPSAESAGSVLKDRYGFEMVYVPEGTVQIGISVERYQELYRNLFDIKYPQTYVEIEGQDGIFDVYTASIGAFWLDRYEITIEQYASNMQECIATGACQKLDWLTTAEPRLTNDKHKPQVGVPWYDALRFCSSREARLPSEQEWEYAAGGVEKSIFPWGNSLQTANVAFQGGTYPVGSKAGNKSWIGAYDMAGNAAEWVEDRFKPYLVSSVWWRKDMNDDYERVIRGGSFDGGFQTVTTYHRGHLHPAISDREVGFRCATSVRPK